MTYHDYESRTRWTLVAVSVGTALFLAADIYIHAAAIGQWFARLMGR